MEKGNGVDNIQLNVVNTEGKQVGNIELDARVFAVPVKEHLVHAVVRWQRAKRRAGTHATLTRTKMKRGNTKPFKQKGTGQARAGSRVSPLMVGGAVAHGPQPRSYEYKLPRKVRAGALCSVLSSKVTANKIVVVDDIKMSEGKTKSMISILNNIGVNKNSVMVITPSKDENVWRSIQNIPNAVPIAVEGANVYDLMKHEFVVGTRDAMVALQDRVLKGIGLVEAK